MDELDNIVKIFTTGVDKIDYQYFHQLIHNRTIVYNQEVDESIIESLYLPLKDFENDTNNKPVTLILNSPGGSITDSLFICNYIDNYSKPLNIIVPAYACSMGTIILCAGNDNPNVTKYCYPFSFGLFHSGQTAVSGEATSVEDTIFFNKAIDDMIKQYIIKHTKITEELYNMHHRKQWYLSAEEMKTYGLVDKIIGSDTNVV